MSLASIQQEIEDAEETIGRVVGSTSIIAVSKLQPIDRVRDLLEQGHWHFGENRVQEAAGKWPPLLEQYPGVNLHMLGPLQSNKARQAMSLFQSIHSLDRISLARKIANLADKTGSCPQLFIQVNTGEEPQKSGVLPAALDDFVEEVRKMELPVGGLMCIPPIDEEPALHFGLLALMATRNGLPCLSMGMSADYVTAVRLGATHVRIGTAVFGERDYGLRR